MCALPCSEQSHHTGQVSHSGNRRVIGRIAWCLIFFEARLEIQLPPSETRERICIKQIFELMKDIMNIW